MSDIFTNPAISVFFSVSLDSFDLGSWSKLSGIGMSIEHQVEAGYGHELLRASLTGPYDVFNNITLERPVSPETAAVISWINAYHMLPIPTAGQIICLDQTGSVVMAWEMIGVSPVSWKGPSMDTYTNNVATEVADPGAHGISVGPRGEQGHVPSGGRSLSRIRGQPPRGWRPARSAPTSSASTRRCRPIKLFLQPRGLHRRHRGQMEGESAAGHQRLPAAMAGGESRPRWTSRSFWTPFPYRPVPPSVVIEQLKLLVAAHRPLDGHGSVHRTDRDVRMGSQHHPGPGRCHQGVGGLRAVPPRCAGPGHGHRHPRRPSPCPLRSGPPTPPRAAWPPGAPTPWWRATPWRRSPTREYRDPNKWRALAEANNIDDPMRVKPGTVLIVPDRRDAESLS